MLITTLAILTPFILGANSLLFEPPSAKRHHASLRRSLSTRAPDATSWVKLGCYIDTVTPRVLSAATIVSDTGMTNAYCQEFCDARGFAIAGTEWSKECFCAASIDSSLLTADGECDMTCTGAPEVCGGSARLTIWQNQGTVTDPNHWTVGDWAGQGCYTDSVQNRALPARKYIDGMTVEKCTAACFAEDFKYAGLEYGNASFSHFITECYCANDIITSAGVGVPATDGCNMPCEGNAAQACGSGDRLNLYLYTPTSGPVQIPSTGDWTFKGCYTDQVNDRAIAVRQSVDGEMTVEKCTAKCLSLGYSLSGLEYANECYCSNDIGASGSPATDGCTMPCEGAASTEICGGSDRLTVYEYTGSDLEAAPTVLDSYNDWNSQGCYIDSVLERVLTPMPDAVAPMTVETCVDACLAAGFTVAGVEYASECYCGDDIPPVDATDGCVMKCDGDAAHLCGGPDRLNVYQKVATAPVDPIYRVRIVKTSDGTQLGYLAQQLSDLKMYTYTVDVSAAALFKPQQPNNGGYFNILRIDTDYPDYPYFGAAGPLGPNFQNASPVKKSDTPQALGSPSTEGTPADSTIVTMSTLWRWGVDISAMQLSRTYMILCTESLLLTFCRICFFCNKKLGSSDNPHELPSNPFWTGEYFLNIRDIGDYGDVYTQVDYYLERAN
ncbi:hypothetical protein M408DRAFT_29080 [Serendipita vermifera MAFF 305830]|uniref:WSC domain-containing protein n=1 Tax=Serendipita vermifera MAFF 305830 TaxID=933852 RepID=A0A0C2W6C5_SERVB|nr:hypothetical protein M408DRAFT_29080 [Serendipita vermifera MAFF 305830]